MSFKKLLNATFLRITLLSVGALIYSQSHATSFDCSKATQPSEKMVCNSPTLSALDDQMFALYSSAKAISPNPESLKQDQIAWIKQLRTCASESCMEQLYKQRISDLSPKNSLAKTVDMSRLASNPSSIRDSQPPQTPIPAQEVKPTEAQATTTNQPEPAPNQIEAPTKPVVAAPVASDSGVIGTLGMMGGYLGGLILTLLVLSIPFLDEIKRRKNRSKPST